MLSILAITIISIYLILIGSFVLGFDKISVFELKDLPAKHKFSIIIPFRNEAKHLPFLLESIKNLQYPKSYFEILFVDDDSDDDSVKHIKESLKNTDFDFTIIKNVRQSQSPKKDSITTAIDASKHQWITTTDADCVLPKFWLDCFDEFIQTKNPKVIVAPVTLHQTTSFFDRFQLIDVFSLQGSTIGSFGIGKPLMANGANLAYHKSVFSKMDGFSKNNTIASGDDIFLLEGAMKLFPKATSYLKNDKAIVATKAEPTFDAYLQQRLRWASKSSHYSNIFSKLTGLIVLFANGTLVCFSVLALAGHFNAKTLFYLLIIKFSIDFLLVFKTVRFYRQTSVLAFYPVIAFLYPFATVFVAVLSVFSSYKWKGRTFKK